MVAEGACAVAVHARREESIWTFLCEAQMVGAEQARKQFLEVRVMPRLP